MRRVLMVLSLMAMAVLAANAAPANQMWITNWDNGNGDGTGASFQLPAGPTFTTDGAIWIDKGTGPQLAAESYYMQTFVNSPSQGWISVDQMYENWQYNGYPGFFSGNTPLIPNLPSVPNDTVVSKSWAFHQYSGSAMTLTELACWTGSGYADYAAAYAAAQAHTPGVYVGRTTPFYVALTFPLEVGFVNMPALIMSVPTPEPSTLLLAATGLLSLLAYAWRRRK